MSKIKVMIIDDSAVMRQVLSNIVNESPCMEVVATVNDPIIAQRKLEFVTPDVITLDVEMSRMDGLTFLEKLMTENPMPVVMCSVMTQNSSETSLQALRLGAVDIVAKPTSQLRTDLQDQRQMIVDSIIAASRARLDKVGRSVPGHPFPRLVVPAKQSADVILPKKPPCHSSPSDKVVAIGASTGGTQSLEFLAASLSPEMPGVVVVQHMPEAFTEAFSARLDSVARVRVKHAEDGDTVETGKILVAPGGRHMIVENRAGKLFVRIKDGPLVNRHRLSVDVLFRSVAQSSAPGQSLGIILTGMGDDGADGMKEMHDAGVYTVAQDEASCVVFGMSAVAIERGGVKKVCSLDQIPGLINAFNRPLRFASYQ